MAEWWHYKCKTLSSSLLPPTHPSNEDEQGFNGADLETFVHGVATGIYDHATTFTSPPVVKATFETTVEDFHNKYEAYKNGGKGQKGAYIIARDNLMKGLDDTAEYVDALPGLTEGIIVLAGYTPTKTGDTQAVLPDAPGVEKIEFGPKGTLIATAKSVAGGSYYGCVVTDKPIAGAINMDNGTFTLDGFDGNFRLILTKGRKKTVNNLDSKTEYWFYFFAGNTAGVSQLGPDMSLVCQ